MTVQVIRVIIFFTFPLLINSLFANTIVVDNKQDLPRIISNAPSGSIIKLKDGIYRITRAIVMKNDKVKLESMSGDRTKVIIDGQLNKGKLERNKCVNEVLAIRASNVTVKGIGIRHARDHGIHVYPIDKEINNVHLNNIHVYDCGQQLIKVNSNGRTPASWTKDCSLTNSLIEFKDNSIMHDMGKHFYTGGIDVHGGYNWLIERNIFKNIQRDTKLMEHAVHMWSKSRGTIVRRNYFYDCYRAIGFGMKTSPRGLIPQYKDKKGDNPFFDHVDGLIENNVIFNRKGIHMESGIELMNVSNVKVFHNTVVSQDKPFSSIEYRWPNTTVIIMNNIVSHSIRQRNGAKGKLATNLQNAPASIFKDYGKGNLQLKTTAKAAINKGTVTSKIDIDGDKRDLKPDLGADELK